MQGDIQRLPVCFSSFWHHRLQGNMRGPIALQVSLDYRWTCWDTSTVSLRWNEVHGLASCYSCRMFTVNLISLSSCIFAWDSTARASILMCLFCSNHTKLLVSVNPWTPNKFLWTPDTCICVRGWLANCSDIKMSLVGYIYNARNWYVVYRHFTGIRWPSCFL